MTSGAAVFLLTSVTAHAQTAPAAPNDGLQDIVVTAQHREQSLQKIPLAVSAISAVDLDKHAIQNVTDLQTTVPNLVIGGNNQQGETPIAIRGISGSTAGIGSENPIAVYLDGVYVGASSGQVFEFGDIDRLEVLRGPQGTLYGRNASGGAISVYTRQPSSELKGEVVGSIGTYGAARVNGWVSGPITDKVQGELAGYYSKLDGQETNLYNGAKVNKTENYGVRAKLKFIPTDRFDFTLSADYGRQQDPAAFHSASPGPFDYKTVNVNEDVKSSRNLGGISGTGNYDLGGAKLTSITAYRQTKTNYNSDSDSLPQAIYQSPILIDVSQLSQELRLASDNSGPISWITGLYYFHSFSTLNYIPKHLGAVYANYDTSNTTDSYAGYVQVDYRPIKDLTLTAGLRYTDDRKTYFTINHFPNALGNPTIPATTQKASFGALTPHFAANYQITPDVMIYASATRGFRAGGFNLTSGTSAFKPEYIWSYEGGLKSEFFDHHVRLNLTYFHYDYTNLQVRQLPAPGISLVLNAGSAKIDGIESELDWQVVPGLTLSAAGAWLKARYAQFAEAGTDLSGNVLNRAPKWNGHVTADYSFDLAGFGKADLGLTYSGQSKEYFSEFNVPLLEGSSFRDLDGRIAFTPDWADKTTFSVVGKNLTNERHITNGLQLASIYYDVTVNQPRTFMFEVRSRF